MNWDDIEKELYRKEIGQTENIWMIWPKYQYWNFSKCLSWKSEKWFSGGHFQTPVPICMWPTWTLRKLYKFCTVWILLCLFHYFDLLLSLDWNYFDFIPVRRCCNLRFSNAVLFQFKIFENRWFSLALLKIRDLRPYS